MIVIKAEIWPGGNARAARTLFEAIIHNTGGDRRKGNYRYLFSKVGGFKANVDDMRTATVKNVLRTGEILGFPRLKLYAHDLLFRALLGAYGSRNLKGAGLFDLEVNLGHEDLTLGQYDFEPERAGQ